MEEERIVRKKKLRPRFQQVTSHLVDWGITLYSLGPGLELYAFNLVENNSTVLGYEPRNNIECMKNYVSTANMLKMTTPLLLS